MKNLLLIILIVAGFQTKIKAQAVFELEGNQSMLMIGKGPGQDATINPLQGEDCYAIIENLGVELFSVRIQQHGKIIAIMPVKPKKQKKLNFW